jgi:hypothetical protein
MMIAWEFSNKKHSMILIFTYYRYYHHNQNGDHNYDYNYHPHQHHHQLCITVLQDFKFYKISNVL